MVHPSYFHVDEREATDKELWQVAVTAISILGIGFVSLVVLAIYLIT
jgi:hypothetical protein